MSQNVLITGANGFVGKAVSRALLQRGDRVMGVVRHADAGYEIAIETADEKGIDWRLD